VEKGKIMVDGVSKNGSTQQTSKSKSYEDFGKLADRLNATIPEQTSNIPDKKRAIDIKKQLLAHPNCPSDAKQELQKEIQILEKEIERIENMNSSVFDRTQKAE